MFSRCAGAWKSAVVDRYFPALDALENELESIEERIFAITSSPRETMEALYAMKQRPIYRFTRFRKAKWV
jgi:Mg2+ and Co2+ transporter CorA